MCGDPPSQFGRGMGGGAPCKVARKSGVGIDLGGLGGFFGKVFLYISRWLAKIL